MRVLTFLLWLLLPCAALAQSDDRSYLTAFLEDNLSDIGRTVTITGFAGALSSRATMTEMTIADSEGVWITLKDVALEWNRSALLSGRISVNTMTAAEIIVARPPIREASGAVLPEAAGFALPELPVSVEIGQIAAAKISLGAPVLGSPVEGRLAASGALIGGEGAVDLLLERTDDGPAGRLALVASYANGSGQLAIDLDAREAAGGVAATLLGLPGAPSVVLTIKGEGPITEYNADLRLASDGVDRLTGRVSLQARSENGQRFSANLTGDLAPLFLPAYAEFFGPIVQLQLAGIRSDDGRLDLSQLSLRTRALTLDGGLVLAADGLPEKFDLTGRLGQDDGLPVLLPLSTDQPTSVTSADLALAFDATKGDGWQGSAAVIGLARADFRAEALRLVGSGQIKRGRGDAVLDAVLRFEAQGLAVSDPGLAQVLGTRLNGNATLNWQEGSGAVTLSRLTLDGSGYGLVAEGRIEGLTSGFGLNGTASARLDDLARLSTLAGRPLGGRAAAQVAGSGSLLGGSFDLEGAIDGTDLHVGQRELDNLLRGTARIGLSLRRDQTGTLIRRLEIAARTLTAAVTGRVATAGSDLAADLAFSDLAVLGGGYRGALTGTGHFTGTPKTGTLTLGALANGLAVGQSDADRVLGGQTEVALALDVRDGQISLNRAELTNPQLAASATGSVGQRGFDLTARLADLALLLPDFPGAVTLTGTAVEGGQGTLVDLRLLGPGRIDAGVSGTIAPGYGQADLAIVGSGQAGLANGLIAPRTASGPLQFDLHLNGPFALASLVGRVALAGGRITDPDHAIAATDITATADLGGGRAQITASAGASTGGQLRASGSVGLTAPYNGDLTIDLQSVGINDPQLYRTSASGQVTVSGPVGGGGLIGGRLVLGTTELRIPSTGLGGVALPDLRHVNEPADVRATRARAGLVDAGRAGRSGPPFLLDLTIEALSRVFIRGRGLDAELGGVLTLGGTTAAVVPNGAFNLIRGRLDILGKRLVLSEARMQLEGEFLPFVRIRASNESDGITTSVLIEGPADAPSVRFVASPELPEEEVLARLMFGRDFTSLSVFQAAQLAGAVATLAGRGGDGIIGKLRKGFGLDDFDVMTDATGGAAVKAGKYLSKNLYTEIIVDQQGQSQINLNLDLSPSITLRGSTGSDSTGIGIFMEKDY
ncbi:MAG: translocation/assembly module TamB domain-containing protein [Pseudorhodobacter sp.]|nr:translocation/assembly module TamB domain-containing protein [Pseudorhodobacter sp.]